MSGVIEGGWEFVWAAYTVTTIVFLVYTGSVISRYRNERKRDGAARGSRI
ncbi:MAG TPA: hypothetical protein VFV54_00450 [Thermoanaerobaculia bacterium]|nr:hypothetical protein [Thermoanaerobaculia bacterium]